MSCASNASQLMIKRHFGDIKGVIAIHEDLTTSAVSLSEHAETLKVGIHLYNSAYNSNCRKCVTNCSNVYPLMQLLKMFG